MGKLLRDETGQQIVNSIKGLNGVNGTGVALPPNDNETYAMKNGEWTKILTTSTPNIPEAATEQINEEGETNVTFFLPWKFAMNTTRTALNDVAHASWRFPFEAGTITKVSIKARTPGGAKVDVLLDGATVLGEPKAVTNAWVDYAANIPVLKNQALELYVTSSLTAVDLSVSVTMDVGNKIIEFIGESDIQPNVYVKGGKASTWGADGTVSPDGQFRSIYMPSVDKLRTLDGGFVARDANDSYKWYICSNYRCLGFNAAVTTPVEFPYKVEDIIGVGVSDSVIYFIALLKDDKIGVYGVNDAIHMMKYNKIPPAEYLAYYPVSMSDDRRKLITDITSMNIIFKFDSPIKKIAGFYSGTQTVQSSKYQVWSFYVLTEDKRLFFIQTDAYRNINTQEVVFDKGYIKNIFALYGDPSSSIFVLTEDNELYAKGNSNVGSLGLSPVEGDNGGVTYSNFTKVGEWDVKKIEGRYNSSAFMLTNDGKLYHAGAANSNLGVTQHNAFTQVFPNYKFYDIAFSETVTLVAIAEYLGEIAG